MPDVVSTGVVTYKDIQAMKMTMTKPAMFLLIVSAGFLWPVRTCLWDNGGRQSIRRTRKWLLFFVCATTCSSSIY